VDRRVQPEDGSRQFQRELGRGQDDLHLLGKLVMIGLVPPEEGQKLASRIGVVAADLPQVAVERGNGLIKGHEGHNPGAFRSQSQTGWLAIRITKEYRANIGGSRVASVSHGRIRNGRKSLESFGFVLCSIATRIMESKRRQVFDLAP